MNKILERAIAAVTALPDADQEAIGASILAELDSERGWDERFARSQDRLAEMARAARRHVAEGGAMPFDPSDHSQQ